MKKELMDALLNEKEIVLYEYRKYDYKNARNVCDEIRMFWYTDDPTDDSDGYITEMVFYLYDMNAEQLDDLWEYTMDNNPWEYAAKDTKNTRAWIEDVAKGDREALDEHFFIDEPYEVLDLDTFAQNVLECKEAIA